MATNVRTWTPDGAITVPASGEAAFKIVQDEALRPRRRVGASAEHAAPAGVCAGIIANARSHRNLNGVRDEIGPGHFQASPQTHEELVDALRDFAGHGVNLLVIDGGDGTIRDVITAAGKVFEQVPRFAVLPSGKTNALALDLGIPHRWSAHDAIEAARAGSFKSRSAIEITRAGSNAPDMRGFIFGAGRFVQATELAQRTHKAGAFNSVAVGLSLGWSILQTLFGGANNAWRAGERMRIGVDDGEVLERSLYLALGTTLTRMPLRLKPFGRTRSGFKILTVDAPPKHLLAMLLPLLAGSERRWLRDAGYRHADPCRVSIAMESGFILDGEHYDGGELTVAAGEPLQFAVP